MFQRMPPPVWSKDQKTIMEKFSSTNPQVLSGLDLSTMVYCIFLSLRQIGGDLPSQGGGLATADCAKFREDEQKHAR